ncbi:GSCOCG00001991001-RA-CDS [Cotesia congregata]|uniref:Uncharacterized protein n=1 Tax=Cotesia congregata TaxID=51543 RepID=A0A8J2HU23_COTCN|nr:GSCOCG00001991001-RA-CDS [Cotesia congregata]CAG5108906.1 Protein of unknown function [Cotesia congregata]
MSLLQIIIPTILSVQFIQIDSKSLDNPLTLKNLQLTAPSFQPKVNFSSPISVKQSMTVGAIKPIGQNRHGKFFYSPSFLTGLGIGSLASSAALSSSPPMLSPNSEPLSRRNSRPMNMFMDTNQSLPRPQISMPPHSLNPYDANYPYFALSTSLFDHSLRSIYSLLENLKNQLANRETSKEPTRVTVKNLNDEINNSAEETSNVKIVSKDDGSHFGVVDRTILKDVIKESIEEINKDLEQRQVVNIRATKNNTNITATNEQNQTENTSTNSPVTAPTPISTTESPIITSSKPEYHGGNPQPIHNVNLINGFPSTEYGHPHNEIHYGPPPSIFDHGNINGYGHDHLFAQNHLHDHGFAQTHPHEHEVFNPNYYHSEPYYGAPENHSPTDFFPSPTAENWPVYPPHARAFKVSSKTIPKTNIFRPSKLV